MFVQDVIGFIESWSPKEVALKNDNTGLQVGDPQQKVTNILVALEITDRIIDEAIENQVNLIITHHPLIYDPINRIDISSWIGRKVARLIKHEITVYSAHTNLDGSNPGVSTELARLLGVEKPEFLSPPDRQWMKKMAVFVPTENVDEVRNAMASAGAGKIGEYSHCSFNLHGSGTFLGSDASSPAKGKRAKLETVEEIRVEMVVPEWKVTDVVAAMCAAHPYEEVAYDIYNLDNHDIHFGFGAIGKLPQPIQLQELSELIRERLGVKALNLMEGPVQQVSRIAVCGGSGGELIKEACRQGAEVFITGEMKYHTYLEYEDRLTVIVVGHYASERVILPLWVEKLQQWLPDNRVSVIETKLLTNPVKTII